MSSHLQAGWALFHANRYRDAMTAAARHLGEDPDSFEARCLLAFSHKHVGELDLALEHAKEAVANAPQSGYAFRTLTWVQIARGERMEAIHSATKAVELDPDDGWNHYVLGYCFEQVDQYDAAVASANAAIERIPHHAEILDLKARCLTMLDRKDEARAVVAEALRVNPENQNARTTLGFLTLDQGAQSKAFAEFREAMRLDPSDRRAQIGYLEAARRSHWIRFFALGATPNTRVWSRRGLVFSFIVGFGFVDVANTAHSEKLKIFGNIVWMLSLTMIGVSYIGSIAMRINFALRADTRRLLPEAERRISVRIAITVFFVSIWTLAAYFGLWGLPTAAVVTLGFAIYLRRFNR